METIVKEQIKTSLFTFSTCDMCRSTTLKDTTQNKLKKKHSVLNVQGMWKKIIGTTHQNHINLVRKMIPFLSGLKKRHGVMDP